MRKHMKSQLYVLNSSFSHKTIRSHWKFFHMSCHFFRKYSHSAYKETRFGYVWESKSWSDNLIMSF